MGKFSFETAVKDSFHAKQAPSWHSCPHPFPSLAVSSLLREAALCDFGTCTLL